MNTSKLTRILTYAAATIFILVPFQALLTTWAGSNFGHIDLYRIWKELLMIFLAFGSLYLVYQDKKLKDWFFHSRLVLLIIIYALIQLGLGMLAISQDKVNSSALIYALLINIRFLVFFLVCLVLAAKSEWLSQNWKKFIIYPAAIVVGFGLLQHFVLPNDWLRHFGYGPNTIPAFQAVDQKPDFVRAQSTLRGPNPLGAYLLVVISCAIAFFINRKKQRWLRAGFIFAAGLVLYFTYSRSAWLGTIVSCLLLVFWFIKDANKRKWLLVGITTVGIVLLITVSIWSNNSVIENTLFHTSDSSQSLESSNEVRSEAIINGASSLIKDPIGDGPGTAGPASVRNNHPARIAENYYIQVGQEVGLVGLAIFVAINLYVAKLLWDNRHQQLAIIALAALAGLALVNLISHAWADDTISYIYWGLAGIALAPSVILNKERKHQHGKTQKLYKEETAKRTN